ncbi:MAG: OPT/YSL family transporter [Deltaproteobacteria bacterium]|nr:OPT/YSL family transporter [Deltaproteobacteria bacterium]MBP7288722.1 OPT/YSL family transporter [Nannocystaceae bacterium]
MTAERELTARAVVVALAVAVLIGVSYPYVVLKLGFGPNIAVVSAFFGWMMLSVVAKGVSIKRESNLAQAAGLIAGQTAFLCTILAAFDMLTADPDVAIDLQLGKLEIFAWLTTAGVLGVLMAVPLRQHFVVDEKLPFPDGLAAGETLLVLDARGEGARQAARAMIGGLVSSAALSFATLRHFIAEVVPMKLGAFAAVTGFGVSLSLLNLGSGIIIGLRICANMVVGSLLSWVIAPPLLAAAGIIAADAHKTDILLWVMWPATGMMVAGGLTSLFLKWRILARTFRQLSGASVDAGDFPMRWVVIGSSVAAVALLLVQRYGLGLPLWQTLLALLFTIPLMLVGLRVFGETNWGPISALSNLMQGVFGFIAPGNVQANMVASGVTGSIVAESEGLMQSYKTAEMVGSTPRYVTIIQLMAVPVGAISLAFAYPVLRDIYGIGGEHGLQSPISQKWVGFAKLLSQGLHVLHPSALLALGIAVVLGVVFTVLEQNRRWHRFVPSPTGIGIGMLVPASAVVTMFVGAVIAAAVSRRRGGQQPPWMLPLASGFIAGEALVAVIIPMLIVLGVMSAM